MVRKNIALLSPNKNAYSETFIQQHRSNLDGNIVFYFNGYMPKENDVEGLLLKRLHAILNKLKRRLKLSDFSSDEIALIKSFKRQKIHVVVAEYGTTSSHVLKVCKHLKLPLIPIFHGYDASIKDVLKSQKNNYKDLLNYADSVLVVSNTIKNTLIALSGGNGDKIKVSPCGPDSLFFDIIPNKKTSNFISIGRFVDKKAPYYTILAFAKVLKKFPESKLTIVGEGILYNTCLNLVAYLGLEDNIYLPGKMSPDKVMIELTNAFIFVQHSIVALNGDSEGTPVAVLEASAASLPVVSTLHSGISDVVINNKTGFLVEEHDVLGMASKMIYLLENREEAILMGKLAKDHIKQNFSLEKHIDIINGLIKKAT